MPSFHRMKNWKQLFTKKKTKIASTSRRIFVWRIKWKYVRYTVHISTSLFKQRVGTFRLFLCKMYTYRKMYIMYVRTYHNRYRIVYTRYKVVICRYKHTMEILYTILVVTKPFSFSNHLHPSRYIWFAYRWWPQAIVCCE